MASSSPTLLRRRALLSVGAAGPATWLARRVGVSALTVLLSTVAVFVAARLLPGDPILAMTGAGLGAPTEEELQLARDEYGLNDPLAVQYARWIGHMLRGDFGVSARNGVDVAQLLGERLGVTLQLALCGILVAAVIGGLGGVHAALRRGRAADHVWGAIAVFGISMPGFWLGLMMILLLSVTWGLLPSSGLVPFSEDPLEWLRSMVMPSLTLGIGLGALVIRQVRAAMVDALQSRYMDAARMKGLTGMRLWWHAVRNSLVPYVTVIGLQLGGLVSGAVVVELLFVIPGLGQLLVDSIAARDYAVVQATALLAAVGYVGVTLMVDMLVFAIDPRLRAAGGTS